MKFAEKPQSLQAALTTFSKQVSAGHACVSDERVLIHEDDDRRERQRIVLLRLPAVLQRLGDLSRAAFYERLDKKSKHFDKELPRPVNLFPGGRAVFWIESELDAYIEQRVAKVRTGAR